jgi:hypothetical protein
MVSESKCWPFYWSAFLVSLLDIVARKSVLSITRNQNMSELHVFIAVLHRGRAMLLEDLILCKLVTAYKHYWSGLIDASATSFTDDQLIGVIALLNIHYYTEYSLPYWIFITIQAQRLAYYPWNYLPHVFEYCSNQNLPLMVHIIQKNIDESKNLEQYMRVSKGWTNEVIIMVAQLLSQDFC